MEALVTMSGKAQMPGSPSDNADPVQTLYASSPRARVVAPSVVTFCANETVPDEASVIVAPVANVIGSPVMLIVSPAVLAVNVAMLAVSPSHVTVTPPSLGESTLFVASHV